MKVFICADMEGITTTTTWKEVDQSYWSYGLHAKQMTEEVLACIQGVKQAGATEIVVKDAHESATNIDPTRMPAGVILLRNWSGHPYQMVEGIDRTFDAALFVGHHSAAGRTGNPTSHTMTARCNYLKLNGMIASEFLLYSYACALEGVPTVFLSGDRMLCEDSKDLHPKLVTCAVKDGSGAITMNYSTEDTIARIRELSEQALTQNLNHALAELPDYFEAEFCFKEHTWAEAASYFPGVIRKNENTVLFQSDNFFEVLRTIKWIMV